MDILHFSVIDADPKGFQDNRLTEERTSEEINFQGEDKLVSGSRITQPQRRAC